MFADRRKKTLATRREDMPIIDNARRSSGRPRSLWLRILRPVVLTLLWLAAVRYVWNHFFGVTDELPIWQQVGLYTIAVCVILLAMLVLAPMRRREFSRERTQAEAGQGDAAESTLSEISQFSNFPADELAQLQQAQRIVVHHDAEGVLNRAEDTDRPPP